MRFVAVVLFVTRMACAQVITTAAGTDWIFPGDGKPAVDAPLGQVQGVTLDPAGNPAIADRQNCMVARVEANGLLTVIAGNGICLGPSSGSTGEGGPATSAAVDTAGGVTYDSHGDLYVLNGQQIFKVSDGMITRIAGQLGNNPGPAAGDGGPATSAVFNAASDVDGTGELAFDSRGNLYFADYWNHRIRKIANGVITTFAGTGNPGFSGDGGQAGKAQINWAHGVAVDQGDNVYIADTSNGRIRKVTPEGIISTVAFNFGGAYGPNSVKVDRAGVLYVASGCGVFKVPSGATKPIPVAGDPYQCGYSGDGGLATQARFSNFLEITLDAAGNIYLGDPSNHRLRKISSGGTVTTIAGNGRFRYAEGEVPRLTAALNQPSSLAFDPARTSLVFGEANSSYRVRMLKGDSVSTVAGTGTLGSAGDGGPATGATIASPWGVTFDVSGNLYFSDWDPGFCSCVHQVSPAGIISTYATGLVGPAGLVFDHSGNLFVAGSSVQGSSQVYKIDPSGKTTTYTGGADAVSSGDGGPASQAKVNHPRGLAVDASGSLYIAEEFGCRVRKITAQGMVSTFAGTGDCRNSGDGDQATKAAIGYPLALAFDAAGNLFVGSHDYLHPGGRVRKIATDGLISTVAGLGPPDQLGDGKVATQAFINSPTDLAFDRNGNLFIADQGNNRIREVLVTPPTMNVAPASIPLPAAASGGAPVTQTFTVTGSLSGLEFTVGIQASGSGKWLTADTTADNTPRLITLTADPANLTPGPYTAVVTITPAAATPAALKMNVSFTVGQALSPKLQIDQSQLSFTLPQGAPARSAPVQVSNSGGQTVSYTASVTTATGGDWLTVSQSAGQATPGKPSTLTVTANPGSLAPGAYTGKISIQSNGGNSTVTAILTVSGNKQAVLLTQTGLSFTAVAQGGVIPPQSFGVINAGTGAMSWTATATTTDGRQWLMISPSADPKATPALKIDGSTDAAAATPQIKVTVNPEGLDAGKYYGTVRVDAPGTANRTRALTIFLSVLAAGSSIAASVQPPELVFYAVPGAGAPGSQALSVYNISALQRSFTSARSSGGFSVYALPGNGTLDPNQPSRVLVQPNGNFPAGTSTATLTFQFSDGTVQGVKITVISAQGAVPVGSLRAQTVLHDQSQPCQQLVVTLNSLSQSFLASANWPVGLSVNVADDCKNPLVAGAVWAHFDDGEDDVALTALGDGTWQGTWKPLKVNPKVTMTIHARSGTLPDPAIAISGELAAEEDRPLFTLDSIGSAFATPTAGVRPVAPGSFLSIYGARLADYTQDAAGGLSNQLANTQVFFNDLPAAFLSHADPGQINVVVPGAVSLFTSFQVRVQRGNALSLPVAVDTAASQTSILQIGGDAYALDSPSSGGNPFQVTATAGAQAGDVVSVYATGLGATDVPVADGQPPTTLAQVPGVTATIGGQDATINFAGLVPGVVALYQLNIVVPSGLPAGPVPLTVTSGGQTSPAVNLAIR